MWNIFVPNYIIGSARPVHLLSTAALGRRFHTNEASSATMLQSPSSSSAASSAASSIASSVVSSGVPSPQVEVDLTSPSMHSVNTRGMGRFNTNPNPTNTNTNPTNTAASMLHIDPSRITLFPTHTNTNTNPIPNTNTNTNTNPIPNTNTNTNTNTIANKSALQKKLKFYRESAKLAQELDDFEEAAKYMKLASDTYQILQQLQ